MALGIDWLPFLLLFFLLCNDLGRKAIGDFQEKFGGIYGALFYSWVGVLLLEVIQLEQNILSDYHTIIFKGEDRRRIMDKDVCIQAVCFLHQGLPFFGVVMLNMTSF